MDLTMSMCLDAKAIGVKTRSSVALCTAYRGKQRLDRLIVGTVVRRENTVPAFNNRFKGLPAALTMYRQKRDVG